MPEPSVAAIGGRQFVHFLPHHAGDGFEEHLSDAHAALDGEGSLAEVD